jgi:hypothetical protein
VQYPLHIKAFFGSFEGKGGEGFEDKGRKKGKGKGD